MGATWIVWENEGNKYTLKSAPDGAHSQDALVNLQMTVKRADGSWEHCGIGKKDLKMFVDGILNNPENTVISVHEKFRPKKMDGSYNTPEFREKMSQIGKARWVERRRNGISGRSGKAQG